MITVDTSAIVAVTNAEPGWEALAERLNEAERRMLSAATACELGMVLESLSHGQVPVERVLDRLQLELIPVGEPHFRSAMTAWRRFGKGRHPAALNFGDCFSYALAEVTGTPLLFVGDDFSRTDIRSALE